MRPYWLCEREEFRLAGTPGVQRRWDVFLSAYTSAERVQVLFSKVRSKSKLWLVFPEYGYSPSELPSNGQVFVCDPRDESDYFRRFWSDHGTMLSGKRVAIDITGFYRPYLPALMTWLARKGVRSFDALYAEPDYYVSRERTAFSGPDVREVRPIQGFEGSHSTDNENDVLVISVGYESDLVAKVSESKDRARKFLILGFPSLRADMFQENVLNTVRAEEALGVQAGDESRTCFAPANDPFATAEVLHGFVHRIRCEKSITNLYLCPLATKPQVLGFALYFLRECKRQPVSMIFPFCRSYSRVTSKGVSRVWRYHVPLGAV